MYAPRAKQIYQQLGVDHTQKTIIYSDSLNVEKALRLKKQCEEVGFRCRLATLRCLSPVTDWTTQGAFGIGTSLTNDFKKKSSGGSQKSKALNMVIKLSSVDSRPTVKISDEITKVSARIRYVLAVRS